MYTACIRETKRSEGGSTTHGRPLLEYLWRPAVCVGTNFYRSAVFAADAVDAWVRVSISSTEIAIFIHKPRLGRAHRAHNKARGLLDRLTLSSVFSE